MDLFIIRLVAVTVFIIGQSGYINSLHLPGCEEPDDLDQLKAILNTAPIHDSFLNIPSNAVELRFLDEIQREAPEYVNIELEPVYGITSCSSHLHRHTTELRTTCPWYFEKNTDSNRYPRTIIQAKCSCEKCLEYLNGIRSENRCKPVPNYIRVLRRVGCTSGRFDYETTLEPLPTGCTCTSHRLRNSHYQHQTLMPEE